MSYSSNEDISEGSKPIETMGRSHVQPVTENLSKGRKLLRSWLGRCFRVVITDGRILVGVFNCTDKDANMVLAGCVEYLVKGGEPRILGNVMIPGKHIVSIEVERRPGERKQVYDGENNATEPSDPPKPQSDEASKSTDTRQQELCPEPSAPSEQSELDPLVTTQTTN